MDKIFEKWPLPWVIYDKDIPGYRCLRDVNGQLILTCEDVELLEFIAFVVNERFGHPTVEYK